jgi:hypothetical protein
MGKRDGIPLNLWFLTFREPKELTFTAIRVAKTEADNYFRESCSIGGSGSTIGHGTEDWRSKDS